MRKRVAKGLFSRTVLAAVAVGAVVAPVILAPSVAAQTSTHKKSASSANHSGSSAGKSSTKNVSSKSHKSSKSSKSRQPRGQAAPTPERISEIQDALAKRGMYSGSSSGKLDDSTADALKKFQASNHLNPNGKLDAPTLQKLGLGSETAGLAAPTPPPNSVANRLLGRNAKQDPSDNN
jgi:hypothetical protein